MFRLLIDGVDGGDHRSDPIDDQEVRIQKAENRAGELGNAQLQAVADCSKHQVSAQLQSLAESVAPVNRLIALINVFAQLAGLGPLRDISNVGTDAAAALKGLDDTMKALQEIRGIIPNNVILSGIDQTVRL